MILPGLIPILIPLFGLSYFQAGLAAMLLVAIPAGLQPLLGHFGDAGKAKQVLIGGLILVSISTAFFGAAPNYIIFLLLSGIAGVVLLHIIHKQLYFCQLTLEEEKGRH